MAKCPVCRGKGYRLRIDDMRFAMAEIVKCESCDGKGVVEPLTEQEYIQTCNTEQLARFLHDVQFSCNTCTLTSFRLYKSKIMKCPLQVSCAKENGVMEWLKQPHTTEVEK